MSGTKILKCNCKGEKDKVFFKTYNISENESAAEYQNKRYGKDMRVHNVTKHNPVRYRCAVCGNIK